MFMMGWLPRQRSPRWWVITGASFVIVTLILWFVRFQIIHQPFTTTHAFRYSLVSFILTLWLGFFGWLGLRRLWFCGMLGTLLGLLMMALTSGDDSGWGDLISLMNFFLAIGLGILVGVVLELLAWVYGAWRRR